MLPLFAVAPTVQAQPQCVSPGAQVPEAFAFDDQTDHLASGGLDFTSGDGINTERPLLRISRPCGR